MLNILRVQLRDKFLRVRRIHVGEERLVVRHDEEAREERHKQQGPSCSAQKKCLLRAATTQPKVLCLIGNVLKSCHCSSILELHFLDILIRADDLVAHLHHQLKRHIRFLHSDHYVV